MTEEIFVPESGITVTAEPLTLAEAKTWLRVGHTADDDRITAMIKVARRMAETLTGRAIATTQTQTGYLARWGGERIWFPCSPVSSITSIAYTDTAGADQTLAAAYYSLCWPEPSFIKLNSGYSWPSVYDEPWPITVVFVAGPASAAANPPGLTHLVRYLLGQLYDSPDGGGVAEAELPAVIRAIVAEFKLPRVVP